MAGSRRAQANAVTVAILASAVLALGVVLYGYFSSQASQALMEQGLIDVYSRYSASLYPRLEASFSENTTDGSGIRLSCYVITLHNRGGDPYLVYLSVLPAAEGSSGLRVYPEVSRIPLDYTLLTVGGQPIERVRVYLVEDVDNDGISEVVGQSGEVLGGEPYFPSCSSIYSNVTAKNLSLPPELVAPDKVLAGVGGADLATLIGAVTQVNVGNLPLWAFTVQPGGSITLFVYTELPEIPPSLSLTLAFEVSGRYYVYSLLSLPLPQG